MDDRIWKAGKFPDDYKYSLREYYELVAELKEDGREYGEPVKEKND